MGPDKNWSRLDNAAKIFPPTSSKRKTQVFRFVCELTEPVDQAVLQEALDRTMKEFPLYRSVLKKGLFWYYFEESGLRPLVRQEDLPVCAPIYSPDKPELLFRVSYYRRRINLELFHALADGAGAMQFLRAMVFTYLQRKYGIPGSLDDYDAARDQKALDAFYQYYDKKGRTSPAKSHRAYRIPGKRLPDHRMGVTEGFLSAKAVLDRAHEYNATLSEFLVALLVCSIYDGMAVRERGRPVVIAVPADLRRFFPTQTARNFFGLISVVVSFRKQGLSFPQVLAEVRESFHSQLTEENLRGIIGRYSAIESNPFVKAIPLQLKILALRIAGWWTEGEDSAGFSNLGRIVMPAAASRYIALFSVFLNTQRPQICLCSFGDTLAVSMSSKLADTGLQRRFFRRLTEMGIPVRLVSNLEQAGGEEDLYATV